jgi:hypothetical protein
MAPFAAAWGSVSVFGEILHPGAKKIESLQQVRRLLFFGKKWHIERNCFLSSPY